jgi:hypothetical protein
MRAGRPVRDRRADPPPLKADAGRVPHPQSGDPSGTPAAANAALL